MRRILVVINSIDKRKYSVIDQSSEKSIYFPLFTSSLLVFDSVLAENIHLHRTGTLYGQKVQQQLPL